MRYLTPNNPKTSEGFGEAAAEAVKDTIQAITLKYSDKRSRQIMVTMTLDLTSDIKEILGWQDNLEGHALVSELSSLGLNLGPAINCHPGLSQAE